MGAPALQLARENILEQSGLGESDLQRVLDSLSARDVDAADLYFQHARREHWMLEDGEVRNAAYNVDQGVGVRVNSGGKTGFAYSDEIALPALESAGRAARAISRQGASQGVQAWRSGDEHPALYQSSDPLGSLSETDKLALLQEADRAARAEDPKVSEVMVSLAGQYETVLVAAMDGTLAADVRPLVRMSITVIATDGNRRERGSAGGGGRYGYDQLRTDGQVAQWARAAVREALINLDSIAAPAGTMPVVLGPGWPGILLHEAVGHGLEGDFNRKASSAFSSLMGQRVASKLCTVVDDGTLPGRRGSLNIDDEGTSTGCNTLIENGILTGYMQDRLNARLMGVAPTGNGRRESYAHLPMPRMTNTFMLNGPHDPEEIIASVDRGLYAVSFGGGQVDITSGKFVFSASEAWLIENGRITRPVRGATLIGNGPDVLTRVSMVGNDMQLDSGIGTCGKEGQSVPVGVGQPTLKVDALTVGGTEQG